MARTSDACHGRVVATLEWLVNRFVLVLVLCAGACNGHETGTHPPQPVETQKAVASEGDADPKAPQGPAATPERSSDPYEAWIRSAAGRETAVLTGSGPVNASALDQEVAAYRFPVRITAGDDSTRLDALVETRGGRVLSDAHHHWAVAKLLSRAKAAGVRGYDSSETCELFLARSETRVCREGRCFLLAGVVPIGEGTIKADGELTCIVGFRRDEATFEKWRVRFSSNGSTAVAGRVAVAVERADRLRGPEGQRRWRRQSGSNQDLDPAPRPEFSFPTGSNTNHFSLSVARTGNQVVSLASHSSEESWGKQEPTVLALWASHGAQEWHTPSFERYQVMRPRLHAARELHGLVAPSDADGPAVVRIHSNDGGSPTGGGSTAIWVIHPPSEGRPVWIRALVVRTDERVGLGTSREADGYEVGITRCRAHAAVTGVNSLLLEWQESWTGTHKRMSDRWPGQWRRQRLHQALHYEPERGFVDDSGAVVSTWRVLPPCSGSTW